MITITNGELAVLSLVVEKSRHAYEIEQVIEERNMRHWTEIGFSSIYRILTKLEEEGWVNGEIQPPEGRGPARKVYYLTPAGEKIWREAALHNLAKPQRKYSSFMLGLDNLGALPKDEAQQAIQLYLNDQQFIHNELSSAVENHPMKEDFFIKSFFDYMLHQLAAEIQWLKAFSQQLDTYYRSME
jgi:DNA-binding PadR family transcriptional regulator